MNDKEYLKIAINLSKESEKDGRFPAGALIVCNDEVISKSITGKYPAINHHAETIVIDEAMEKLNRQLSDCTLYTSMESCLMCISKAYWAGIRRVVFAQKKSEVNIEGAYEGDYNIEDIVKSFDEKIEYIHIKI